MPVMNDVGRLLRDADPLAREEGLSRVTTADMRRAIVTAARDASRPAVWWPRPLVVAATVAVTLSAGVIIGRALPLRDSRAVSARPESSSSAAAAVANAKRRQLQFATPGGTRIIWVFDPDFNP
jgi:hypothetical protein